MAWPRMTPSGTKSRAGRRLGRRLLAGQRRIEAIGRHEEQAVRLMLVVVALLGLGVERERGFGPAEQEVFGEAADAGAALGIDADQADRPGDGHAAGS